MSYNTDVEGINITFRIHIFTKLKSNHHVIDSNLTRRYNNYTRGCSSSQLGNIKGDI